jgi:hypothetical protein
MRYTEETLRANIEYGRKIGASTAYYKSVTGEPYVTIGLQHLDEGPPKIPGTVGECKRRELGFDEETAWNQAATCFQMYADTRPEFGTLYWRQPPVLEWNEDKSRCIFYMRLLISDK